MDDHHFLRRKHVPVERVFKEFPVAVVKHHCQGEQGFRGGEPADFSFCQRVEFLIICSPACLDGGVGGMPFNGQGYLDDRRFRFRFCLCGMSQAAGGAQGNKGGGQKKYLRLMVRGV